MKDKVDAEIKRLEAKMTELRNIMGVMYTLEMHEIDAQIRALRKVRKDEA